MAYEVVIPRLGLTMEEGQIVEWYKQDGEFIQAGEPMFAVETDKIVIDVQAPFSGVFYRVPNLPSGPLPIGHLIAYILEPGETFAELGAAPAGVAEGTPAKIEEEHVVLAPQGAKSASNKRLSSPAARRRAKERGIDWTAIERPDGGPILLVHVEQFAKATPRHEEVKASPLARRVAEEFGVDLVELAAEKPGQKITRKDVQAYAAAQTAAPAPSPPVPEKERVVPLTMTRRTIAQRMAESAHTTAPVTMTTEADVTELVSQRERMKADLEGRDLIVPSYTDLIVKLTSVALQDHPGMNASLRDGTIVFHENIHIGLAVDTEEGLLVPVTRDVASKSIQEIAVEARSLAVKARQRKLTPDDLQGGTFTITNLGPYGIDAFTPIINLPECAILGIGRIISKPAVYNDEIVPRKMMALSLTFDHRVVDGAPAARFLDTIRDYAEHPYLWLVR